MEKNKKVNLQSLLYNTNFLLGFSIVMALIIWIAVTLNKSPEVERTVKNVKVEIDTSVPEQLGYEVFGDDEYFVDVTVKGKRYLVGDNVLSANDIKVTAVTTNVDGAGKHSLSLKATAKDSTSDYTITSKSLDYIDVYFDVSKKIEMEVTPDIVLSDKLLYSDEYISDTALLSTEKVTITGPATEINKIKNVFAKVNIEEPLKATQTFSAELFITDEYGEIPKYLEVTPNLDTLTVTIPVYKITQLPVSVEFNNSPTAYLQNILGVTANPSTIRIAAPEDVIANMTSVSVGVVDFNNIKEGKNSISFKTADIANVKVLDDISEILVTVDATGMKSKNGNIKSSNISIKNVPSGYTAVVAQDVISDVIIVGPASEIETLNDDDIYAQVNLDSKKISEGKQTVTAQVTVKNGKFWAYGIYKVQINVTAE
ncbi:MAG: hypothetical protein EOM05_03235 [Clostridia bacterium]|nr:hypothetical protein [Clostridia bacterium]